MTKPDQISMISQFRCLKLPISRTDLHGPLEFEITESTVFILFFRMVEFPRGSRSYTVDQRGKECYTSNLAQ